MINNTLAYLLARRREMLLCFSGAVTTTATYLKGAGGEAGDGLPLPRAGRILRIDCWDGSNLVSASGNVSVAQGQRVSVHATPSGGAFNVTLRLNGVATTLSASGAGQNATLFVTALVQLDG